MGSIVADASSNLTSISVMKHQQETGHNEGNQDNGSVDAEQTIDSDISISTEEDLIMKSSGGGKNLIGHQISEINAGHGYSNWQGT